MHKLGQAMFYRCIGPQLSEVVGVPRFASIALHLGDYGVPPTLAQSMKPGGLHHLEHAGGAGAEPLAPIDECRPCRGQAGGGPQSVDEQLAVFENVAEGDQVTMLREVACHYEVFQHELDEMVEAYVARDLIALIEQSECYDSEGKEAFMDKLLYERNARMAERMLPLLSAGQAFIAVGALHLPGERRGAAAAGKTGLPGRGAILSAHGRSPSARDEREHPLRQNAWARQRFRVARLNSAERQFGLSAAQIAQLADRRFGIGCDQVLSLDTSNWAAAAVRYRVYNADGSAPSIAAMACAAWRATWPGAARRRPAKCWSK